MKKVYDKIEKSVVSEFPTRVYDGRIYVIISEDEAQRACQYLLQSTILGIDTETRPNFLRGKMHPVALLQIANEECCFLFRLNHIGLPPCVVTLLESPSILKVGVSLKDDWGQLRQRAIFQPQNFIELQAMVKEIGIQDMSLQKIYANLFHQRISKSQQLSNWEADALTSAQQHYAALDASACVEIYQEVVRLKETNDYKLISVPCPTSQVTSP